MQSHPLGLSRASRLARSGLLRGLWRRLSSGAGAWALADQAVVSLGNYLTGLVVLQTMPKEEFGIFFLLTGLLLLLNTVQWSVVNYPLSVRGATAEKAELRRLVGTYLAGTVLLALVLLPVVLLVTAYMQRLSLAPWVFAAMLAWQMQETLRRGLMSHLRHDGVLLGDAIAYGGRAAGVAAFALSGMLSLEIAFASIAVASCLGLLVQLAQVRPFAPTRASLRAALCGDWSISGWMLLTGAVSMLTMQAVPWTLSWFQGLAAVAEFGAMALVMALPNPIIIAIGGLIVPAVAATASQGKAAVRGAALNFALPGAALLLPYFALVLLEPAWAYSMLAGSAGHAGLETHLRLYALGYAMTLPGQVMQSILAGLGQPRAGFAAQAGHLGATLLVSVPAAAAYGLTGAVWAGLLPGLILSLLGLVILRRVTAGRARDGATG